MTEYTIDITTEKENSLGRISTKIADMLRGKNTPQYAPNVAPKVKVYVNNASKLEFSPAQMETLYKRFSGYPGGLKLFTREKMIAKHGYAEVIRRAVRGMLPSNKLRPVMLKNLIITE